MSMVPREMIGNAGASTALGITAAVASYLLLFKDTAGPLALPSMDREFGLA